MRQKCQTVSLRHCALDISSTLSYRGLTEHLTEVRISLVNPTSKVDSVWFTTKGQVVIPAWLRKEFQIEDGTKAIVHATPDGILLKPVTSALIKKGRGILKQSNGKSFAQEWAEHKASERELEDKYGS